MGEGIKLGPDITQFAGCGDGRVNNAKLEGIKLDDLLEK